VANGAVAFTTKRDNRTYVSVMPHAEVKQAAE
jgi:ribosomal protein L27